MKYLGIEHLDVMFDHYYLILILFNVILCIICYQIPTCHKTIFISTPVPVPLLAWPPALLPVILSNLILFYFTSFIDLLNTHTTPHHITHHDITPHHTPPHHTTSHHTTPHPLIATAQNCLPHIPAIFSCKSHSSNHFFHDDFILHQTQLDEIYRYCTILY